MSRRRLVIVKRRTELEELLDIHTTRGQAEFFLTSRQRSLAPVQSAHDYTHAAYRTIRAAIPETWGVAEVERADLPQFLFSPSDIVAVVGPDGLVANTAKYVTAQPILGINPSPTASPSPLLRCTVQTGVATLHAWARGHTPTVSSLTMVRADLDDSQHLTALNEIYVGHASHQSARYDLRVGERTERQSSSGVIVATGTGATGWAASLIHGWQEWPLPRPHERRLAWFVREAWPSAHTATSLTAGFLSPGDYVELTVTSERLVLFGDGVETDYCAATWGQTVRVGLADTCVHLAEPIH